MLHFYTSFFVICDIVELPFDEFLTHCSLSVLNSRMTISFFITCFLLLGFLFTLFSRAHTIVGVTFIQKNKNAAGEETAKSSVVNLVDLAGR